MKKDDGCLHKLLVFVCVEISVIGRWPTRALSQYFGRCGTEDPGGLALGHGLGSHAVLQLAPFSMVGPLLLSLSLLPSFVFALV